MTERARLAICSGDAGDVVSIEKDAAELSVPPAAARRLSNQLARAHRGTYGAEAGLRTVVRSVSVQLLRAGSSQEVVSRALTEYVRNCPLPAAPPKLRQGNEAMRANALVALTEECVAAAALEMARQRCIPLPVRAHS